MAADGRFGGHIVSGHIDGTGTHRRRPRATTTPSGTPVETPGGVCCAYIVEKGSIAIDGVSLTVAAVERTRASAVSIIPHTGGT